MWRLSSLRVNLQARIQSLDTDLQESGRISNLTVGMPEGAGEQHWHFGLRTTISCVPPCQQPYGGEEGRSHKS